LSVGTCHRRCPRRHAVQLRGPVRYRYIAYVIDTSVTIIKCCRCQAVPRGLDETGTARAAQARWVSGLTSALLTAVMMQGDAGSTGWVGLRLNVCASHSNDVASKLARLPSGRFSGDWSALLDHPTRRCAEEHATVHVCSAAHMQSAHFVTLPALCFMRSVSDLCLQARGGRSDRHELY
jgi:hypothetical protein